MSSSGPPVDWDRRLFVAWLFVVSVVLAACTSTAEDSATSTTVAGTDGESLEVKTQRFLDCMVDRGFVYEEVKPPPEPQYHWPGSEHHAELWKEATLSCSVEAGLASGEPSPPPSAEYMSAYYDFLLELAACAEREGFATTPPPARETFVEEGGLVWHPYNRFGATIAEADWQRLEAACPQDFVFSP